MGNTVPYSPESWTRVREEATLLSGAGGVIATLRPDTSAAKLTGTGNTSTAAMHALAMKLDEWKAQNSYATGGVVSAEAAAEAVAKIEANRP